MQRLIFIVLIAFLFLVDSLAQSNVLVLNQPFSSSVAANTQETFRFTAREGEVLSFVVEGSQSLDSILEILDLNGNSLIQVDDFDSAGDRDAILEAFTAPYTGNYDLVIAGYGSTVGDYTVTMQQGYGQLVTLSTFDNSQGWETQDIGAEVEPELTISNEVLLLRQEGIDTPAYVLGISPETDNYYTKVDIKSVLGTQGWRVGMVFNYSGSQYYELLINDGGNWRIARYDEDTVTVLRDWSSHPAIRAGNASFSLGVLANGNSYELFYDSQFIGSITDDARAEGGIGLTIRTANAFGSTVTATFDDFVLTTPLSDDNYVPEQLVGGRNTYVVRELERRLVIPNGGAMVLGLNESFAQNIDAGVSRFQIASNIHPTNFVLGATVSWDSQGNQQNGCGLIIRDNPVENTYWLAYVDNDGGYGTANRVNDGFSESYYNTAIPLGDVPYQLMIVALDNQVHFYINNYLAHTTRYEAIEGAIGEAIVNFEAGNTTCNYSDIWLWRLD